MGSTATALWSLDNDVAVSSAAMCTNDAVCALGIRGRIAGDNDALR